MTVLARASVVSAAIAIIFFVLLMLWRWRHSRGKRRMSPIKVAATSSRRRCTWMCKTKTENTEYSLRWKCIYKENCEWMENMDRTPSKCTPAKFSSIYFRSAEKHACHICHRQFLWKSNLATHAARHLGGGGKRFACAVCGKAFGWRSNLNKHMETHAAATSQPPRRHECVECHKRFASKSGLTVHMAKHYDEGRFVCSVCNKSFTWKANYNVHMAAKHPEVDRSAYHSSSSSSASSDHVLSSSLNHHHHHQQQQHQLIEHKTFTDLDSPANREANREADQMQQPPRATCELAYPPPPPPYPTTTTSEAAMNLSAHHHQMAAAAYHGMNALAS
ncbi:hypothetical protein LSTR_LSTR012778 [Laodelphax striatellus]|uniref:C2H2-type domain-containing protein n=1 Tax=Laodelphax striatellus TaxID=195883 RepID=A0A482XCF7_LAOST|nr:hypothetical protein LSTR_LSTR012778 [Laodelphax striatellus]